MKMFEASNTVAAVAVCLMVATVVTALCVSDCQMKSTCVKHHSPQKCGVYKPPSFKK